MANPQIDTTTYTSLCSLGWRPLLLTGFLVDWMRKHFSVGNVTEDPDLSNTLWKADDTSVILIESITRWKPSDTEKRPAVIIRRNDITNERQGIDDKLMGAFPRTNGPDSFTTYFKGSHTLFCITREGAEAEKLAAEVYRELVEFGKVYRDELRLIKLQLQSIGAIFKVEECKETFAVPVTISYAFDESWTIIPRAPVLKRIDLSDFQP